MGLPPGNSKFSTDTNPVTTFFWNFPNFTASHSGVTATVGINSVAGGGTGLATLTSGSVLVGAGTSSPTLVAPGPVNNVLTSNGSTWISSPGSGATAGFDYFNSTMVNTQSNALSSSTFTTFSNSPAFTFTANFTGKYKVYASIPLFSDVEGTTANTRIYNTAGTPSPLAEDLVANATSTLVINTEWVAQSFIPSSTATLSSTVFKLQSTGTISGPLYVGIYTDSAGSPGTLLETSQYIQSSTVTGTATDYIFYFSNTTSLTASTTYYVVLNQGSVTGTGSLTISYDNTGSYSSGVFQISLNSGGTWVDQTGTDLYFQVNTSINPPTLLAESQATVIISNAGNSVLAASITAQSVYSLVAGSTYTFDIQGSNLASGDVIYLYAAFCPFYMFAERCG